MRFGLGMILAALLLSGCASQRLPGPGDMYGGRTWQTLSQDQLQERILKADVVLVGERHANPPDHQLQLKVLKLMAAQTSGLVVGIEWLDFTDQALCDRLSQGEINSSQFAEQVGWTQKWGHNFTAYQPVFDEIRKRNLRLLALNAPLALVRKIARQGIDSLSLTERAQLPEKMQLSDPEYLKLISGEFRGHGVMSPQARQNFVAAQIARDETMAQGMAQALSPWPQSKQRGLLLVGRGHLELGLGLPPRLAGRLPGAKLLVLLPLSQSEARELRESGKQPSDQEIWLITEPVKPKPKGRLGLVLMPHEGGLQVVHVRNDSPADRAGFKPGDLLSRIDGQPLKSTKGIHDAIKQAPFKPHTYTVIRDKRTLELSIRLSP